MLVSRVPLLTSRRLPRLGLWRWRPHKRSLSASRTIANSVDPAYENTRSKETEWIFRVDHCTISWVRCRHLLLNLVGVSACSPGRCHNLQAHAYHQSQSTSGAAKLSPKVRHPSNQCEERRECCRCILVAVQHLLRLCSTLTGKDVRFV